jgi:hypothetical protein
MEYKKILHFFERKLKKFGIKFKLEERFKMFKNVLFNFSSKIRIKLIKKAVIFNYTNWLKILAPEIKVKKVNEFLPIEVKYAKEREKYVLDKKNLLHTDIFIFNNLNEAKIKDIINSKDLDSETREYIRQLKENEKIINEKILFLKYFRIRFYDKYNFSNTNLTGCKSNATYDYKIIEKKPDDNYLIKIYEDFKEEIIETKEEIKKTRKRKKSSEKKLETSITIKFEDIDLKKR